MKRILLLSMLGTSFFANAQAYTGKEDNKIQVGAAFQNNATSIRASVDYGLGVNMSYGIASSYILNYANGNASEFPLKIELI